MEERENGAVKWFDASKGYGFITREQGEDIFVHYIVAFVEMVIASSRKVRQSEFTVVDGEREGRKPRTLS